MPCVNKQDVPQFKETQNYDTGVPNLLGTSRKKMQTRDDECIGRTNKLSK